VNEWEFAVEKVGTVAIEGSAVALNFHDYVLNGRILLGRDKEGANTLHGIFVGLANFHRISFSDW
jgi:hypothetical protein